MVQPAFYQQVCEITHNNKKNFFLFFNVSAICGANRKKS